jgi:hypothetical protein
MSDRHPAFASSVPVIAAPTKANILEYKRLLQLSRLAKPGLAPQTVTVPTQFIKRDSCRPILILKENSSKKGTQEALSR